MTKIQRVCSVMFAAVLLAACGQSSEKEKRPEPPPVKDTAFGDMVGTMDKARGVEATIQQSKEAIDRAEQDQASGAQ
jgi:nitrous oxide reductase accessory protein NosL